MRWCQVALIAVFLLALQYSGNQARCNNRRSTVVKINAGGTNITVQQCNGGSCRSSSYQNSKICFGPKCRRCKANEKRKCCSGSSGCTQTNIIIDISCNNNTSGNNTNPGGNNTSSGGSTASSSASASANGGNSTATATATASASANGGNSTATATSSATASTNGGNSTVTATASASANSTATDPNNGGNQTTTNPPPNGGN